MKILILSSANSIHTKRWVFSLAGQGIEICLFSIEKCLDTEYYQSSNVRLIEGELNANNSEGSVQKIILLKYLPRLRKAIRFFKPDILHAHYSTSYGLLGALTDFHPYIISVWGSDVYDFPNISLVHKMLLMYNLKKADAVLSTSHIMAQEANKYTSKTIQVTPFGVDTNHFKKLAVKKNDEFIVGNVKTLAPKYGIDILIEAFKLVVKNNPERKLKLVLVGEGPNKEDYIKLTKELNIENLVEFMGAIPNNELPRKCYNKFNVSVSVSNSESFGVVAVEAMACECPVIVSDADGFTEVVKDRETGFIVPKRDVEATAKTIQKFIDAPELREIIGRQGRERVLQLYDWKNNVNTMMDVYKSILNK